MGFRMIYWTPISGSYFLKGCILEKCEPFFRADMAGLGKYCTGGCGRIGVYRVKDSGMDGNRMLVLAYSPVTSMTKRCE